jgi:hypothetical protein
MVLLKRNLEGSRVHSYVAGDVPYARNWVGKVDWYIDNTGVINNFRRMHRWVANDWSKSKAGDRDVNGYIDVMRQQVKGEWTVQVVKKNILGAGC